MSKKILVLILAVACLSFAPNSDFDRSYKHMASGTTFPKKVGSFLIIGPTLFDEKGMDVGIGYTRRGIEITQYIYPAVGSNENSLVDEEYEKCKNYILEDNPFSGIIEETDYTFNGVKGECLKYEDIALFHESYQRLISYLYIFEDKGWFIKIRISHRSDKRESSLNKIDEYLENIPWPTLKRER